MVSALSVRPPTSVALSTFYYRPSLPSLCVDTSIQLNIIPEKRYYGIQRAWIYKYYWVLIALVAPELVFMLPISNGQTQRALRSAEETGSRQ